MTGAMTRERALEIFAAYGGRPDRWPEAERAALLRLLLAEPDLRAARDEALALDATLDAASLDDPTVEAAVARALAGFKAAARPDWRSLAAGLAACAALGLAFGFGAGRDLSIRSEADAALDQALGVDQSELILGLDG